MRRGAFKVVVVLLLGAIVNVAVAWALAAYGPFCGAVKFADTASSAEIAEWRAREEFRHIDPSVIHHVGLRLLILYGPTRGVSAVSDHGYEMKVGLPLPSMRFLTVNDKTDGVVCYPSHLTVGGEQVPFLLWPRYLPRRCLCPGFAVNTIFYAGLLWVVFFAPGKVRRTIRRRRGLCPACAYPNGTSPVCTECGAAVTRSNKQ